MGGQPQASGADLEARGAESAAKIAEGVKLALPKPRPGLLQLAIQMWRQVTSGPAVE